MNKNTKQTTHFGFEEVPIAEKVHKVGAVFDSVASKYDLMNDLMSFGIHRLWKHFTINIANIRPGQKILDLAGGTGDLTAKISPLIGKQGRIILADINKAMLTTGKDQLIDRGLYHNISYVQTDAEQLAFPSSYFEQVVIGFGLRNVTDQQQALQEMHRVILPGGQLLILEFSKPQLKGLSKLYDAYSFSILPKLGEYIAKDETSYRYLAESIRKHPDQKTLASMMQDAGFEDIDYFNLAGGIVAVHRGRKY